MLKYCSFGLVVGITLLLIGLGMWLYSVFWPF